MQGSRVVLAPKACPVSNILLLRVLIQTSIMCHSNARKPASSQDIPQSVPDEIPSDAVSQAAFKHAAQHLAPTILNHSIRVFLFAKAIADRERSEWTSSERLPLLSTACILHDIGTVELHNGPLRFEVEGADAAKELLRQHDVREQYAHEVWVAIAVHTSRQIAERISSLARLVRLGVTVDFQGPAYMEYTTNDQIEDFEKRFPRLDVEKVLGDAVADQTMQRPEKAPPASWPGDLHKAKLEHPEWTGVNKGF